MQQSSFDERFMQIALEASEKGKYISPPNPWVGCVIVKDNQILSTGYHKGVGTNHAEVEALKKLSLEQTKNATAYVTLEPCCHFGKTPPCVNALIKANISRVVVGVLDPDKRVSGQGIAQLKQANIQVITGVLKDKISTSLYPYLYQRRYSRPYCIAKAAISIDGKIAANDGSSKWISSQKARDDVHLLRALSQAILIGSQTAIKDLPKLTVRHPLVKLKKQPLRIVLDHRNRLKADHPFFVDQLAETWHINDPNIDLTTLLQKLNQKGVLQLLIEGGGQTISSFMQKGFANELHLYIGAKIIGQNGVPFYPKVLSNSIEQAKTLSLKEVKRFDDTIKLVYQL